MPDEAPKKKASRASMRARWKDAEREIAALIGGERVPITGRTRGSAPDIQHPTLGVEVKSQGERTKRWDDAFDQAEKAALHQQKRDGQERLPIVILHSVGRHHKNDIVMIRLRDFIEWYVSIEDKNGTAAE